MIDALNFAVLGVAAVWLFDVLLDYLNRRGKR